MSTRQLFKNNVSVALAAGITNVALTGTVSAGLGSLFGAIAAGEHIEATISDDTGAFEIVKITAVAGDVLTWARAQEGTTGRTFNLVDAPKVSIRLTAGTMERMAQKDADDTISGDWTFSDGGARLGNIVSFAASGTTNATSTYTPSANLKFAIVEVQAAGGGGGAGSTADGACGGGGGAGGFARKKITAATIGASQSVTAGGGGTAGPTSAGGTGGTSSFGAIVSATGGAGGFEGTSATGFAGAGAGGGGVSGDLNLAGGSGHAGSGLAGLGGHGGDAYLGGGAAGGVAGGVTGGEYGGGGSGGKRTGGTNRAGGIGGPGIVIVYEYF